MAVQREKTLELAPEYAAMEPAPPSLNIPLPSGSQILAVVAGLAKVIGARLGLLLAIIGGFAVTWRVLGSASDPGPNTVWVLLIYLGATILPMTFLNVYRAA